MSKRTISLVVCTLFLALNGPQAFCASVDDNWPSWRGPTGNGVATKGNPPTTWSDTENIKWKVKIPGKNSSTPVVWGNKLFLQTAVSTAEEASAPAAPQGGRRRGHSAPTPKSPYLFNVVCIDRLSGEVIWQKTAAEATPHEGHHPTGNFAPYSPITDGEKLWTSFGSRGLYCYDLDGNLQWRADLMQMKIKLNFGEGSSPTLAGDNVIVVMDHEAGSKIFAFNKDTGEKVWERDRNERTSWASPLTVEVDGRIQVITNATNTIRSYDAETGDVVWECSGLTANSIPSPVIGFGNVYCMSGFRGHALKAIELGHKGDLTDSAAIKWEVGESTPYVASPLLIGDRLYLTADLRPSLSCYDAKTGKAHFVAEKLEGLKQIYASPIGANGRIYISDREGTTVVINAADTLEVLATNVLDDGFDASPVVIGNELYLNGMNYLYCIAES